MDPNIKKVIAAIAAAGLLSSGAVFAEYDPDKVIDPSFEYVTTVAPEGEGTPVNNTDDNGNSIYNGASLVVDTKDVNGSVMVPLRAIAEAMGYIVQWNGEDSSISLTRGAQYLRMVLDSDEYTFSKAAPISLGAAPTLVNDSVTYVPIQFVSDIIGGWYTQNDDGTAKVVDPAIVQISEINTDEYGTSITVNDPAMGTVIVRVSEDTVIANAEAVASVADLTEGATIAVEYSDAMTMSLPPQTTAVRIMYTPAVIVEEVATENTEGTETSTSNAVEFSGKVSAVSKEENTVTIGEGVDAIVLNVTDETSITKGNDRRRYMIDDIEVGTEISGTHDAAMTKSIPPQTSAIAIALPVE